MDTHRLPIEEMQRTLHFLSLTNKFFGGSAVILQKLNEWSRTWKKNEAVTILDIGCGAGDILIQIAKWGKKNGHVLSLVGIDLIPEIIDIARTNSSSFENILIEKKDFFEFINEQKKFDYVISSLFLHHTPERDFTKVLQGFDSLAKRGVLISDLLRSQPSYWAVSICSYLLGNKIVRHDGPLSVKRAFQINELQNLARLAGLDFYLQPKREPWFRVSLSGIKSL